MSRFDDLSSEERARIEAAIAWRERLRQNPALELSSSYVDWISHADNVRVSNALDEGLAAFSAAASAPEVIDFRRQALDRARHTLPRHPWLSYRRAWQLAAASLAIATVGGAGLAYYLTAPADYATGIGERRVVALTDGSRISLDSDSEVHVQYSQSGRAIVLDRGRARFDVTHDVKRPFTVSAGTETVVAVGTSFNVERLGATVVVTLIQGHVVIKDSAQPAAGSSGPAIPVTKSAVSLSAGEQLVTKVDAKPLVAPANLQTAVAWETGRLVFQDESLAAAVERVNRYTEKPISVDPSVANLRINGVFNAGDIGSFIGAVTSYFPVQASTDSENNIVLQKRS